MVRSRFRHSFPPVVVAESRRLRDDALQAGHVGRKHDARRRPLRTAVACTREPFMPQSTSSPLAGVDPHPESTQVATQRVPQRDIVVGVGDVEEQALAGAQEVDVEHRRELGSRQLGGAGEEAAGEHLERQMSRRFGKIDVAKKVSASLWSSRW